MEKSNVNGLDCTNKYVQGTVWKWSRKEYSDNTAGVQSSERPVLIISNDTYNAFSQSVNCVSITSVLKESPVHVPIYINMDSHIQCEQIHTVSKSELTEFKGVVQPIVMSNVKAKIRMQFDMSEDRGVDLLNIIKKSIDELIVKSNRPLPTKNIELLNIIKDNLHELNKKANKGFGLPEIENDFIKYLTNINDTYETINKEISTIKSLLDNKNTVNINPPVKPIVETKISDNSGDLINIVGKDKKSQTIRDEKIEPKSVSRRGRGNQRKYTDEDKKFIADVNNPIEELMKKYGYKKIYAQKMRKYFQERLKDDNKKEKAINNIEETDTHQKHMRYSDEDIRFITDKKNSIAAVVKKYGFDNKSAAYRARNYLKRAYLKK